MKDYLFLPDRLKEVARLIPKCDTLSDIGTDHAYIPIFSIKNDIAKNAIAADIVDGPLKIAQQNIADYNLQDKISVVKSDGLKNVPLCDVTVIAGMGGTLIAEILLNDLEKAHNTKLLILQPMTCAYELRKELHKMGFEIIEEALAKDSGKLYNIMCVKKGEQTFCDETDYFLGKDNIDKNPPLMGEFLAYKIKVLNTKISNMKNSDNPEILKEAENQELLVKSYKEVGERLGISL